MSEQPPGYGEAPEHRFRLLVESVVDYAIFMLDPDGTVLTWNGGAERLKGYRAEEIIGRHVRRLLPAGGDRQRLAAGTSWRSRPTRAATRRKAGGCARTAAAFWANVVITALRGSDGRLEGYAKVTRDLTEKRRREEALRQSEEQFRLLLESVKDYAIFMLDPEGRILTWNTGAEAIKGYTASEMMGRHFRIFFTAQDVVDGKPETELKLARASGRAESEGWRVRKDGSVFWANVVLTPVHDADGMLRGFAKVTRDLSERRRSHEVEQAGKRMQEFIAMLAHELRNPLAPIRNAVSLLQEAGVSEASRLQATGIVDRQLGHLTHLVDDLLDVGRIATGKILLRDEIIDYREVVVLSLESARDAIDRGGHALIVDLPEQPMPLRGDPTRLTQALLNLLTNAAKYTPENGRIGLQVAVVGGLIVTAVSDNGRGIAPDAQERIFDLFTQERPASGMDDPGLGIGLALARALVEQHGGRLTAESAGLGHGSTFWITLPIADAATLPRAGAPAATKAADRAQAPFPPLRILVVDDNQDAADMLAALLGALGHESRTAYGAREALAVVQGFSPELVFLDLNMPDGDGVTLLPKLRSVFGDAVYVAALTGYGQQHDRDTTRAAGFQAHLTKPVAIETLEATLATAAAARG